MGLWRADNVDLGLNLGGKSPSTDHLAQHCGSGGWTWPVLLSCGVNHSVGSIQHHSAMENGQ